MNNEEFKRIIKLVDRIALSEIKRYGAPSFVFYNLTNKAGQKIAKKLNADQNIVAIGTRLMDIKLGQAFKEDRLKDHIKMSSDKTIEILNNFKISEKLSKIIVNCVEAHHGTVKYNSLESEICANADCYKFLTPLGFVDYLTSLGKRDMTLKEIVDWCDSKVEEKWNTLSLKVIKKELEQNYLNFKNILKSAKNDKILKSS